MTALLTVVLALAGTAHAGKPPLKRACQLVTTHQVSAIMGRTMKRSANDPTGCGWRSGPIDQAGLELYGFKTVKAAKEYLQGGPVADFELCVDPPNQFLPGSGLGDEAWLDSCNSNVAFRLGRVTGEVTESTSDVKEGSHTDAHRATAIARKAVARLRKLRCPPSFCYGT
ncbi:MAG TPA: hypothetical protein VF032_06470 [Thermoleophilaceae bacterium]